MQMISDRVELEPSRKVEAQMISVIKIVVWCSRWCLREWQRQYKAGIKPNVFTIQKSLTILKKENPWLHIVPISALQGAAWDLGDAFQRFFRGLKGKGSKSRYPKGKIHQDGRGSFYINNQQFRAKSENSVRMSKIGTIEIKRPLRFHNPDGSVKAGYKIMGCTISRSAGKWWASIQYQVADSITESQKVAPQDGSVVGLDLNLHHHVDSEGNRYKTSRFYRAVEDRLKLLNRSIGRKQKGSNNHKKAKLLRQKLELRVANCRKDLNHKLTTELSKKYHIIVIEDLDVRSMVKGRRLSKSLMDAGFGQIKRLFQYKTLKFGSKLIIADRYFPSTQLCSQCEHRKESDAKLTLKDRVYCCDHCGVILDRDYNAALNLKRYPRILGNSDSRVQELENLIPGSKACGSSASTGLIINPTSC